MSTEPSLPTFTVGLHGISADCSEIGTQFDPQDLGAITSDALVAHLKKFAAIDPLMLVDSDPKISISGRRGCFIVKNNLGKLILRPSGDPIATFLELTPQEIPEWLDQADDFSFNTTQEREEDILIDKISSRMRLVTVLMIISLGAFGTSVYFSFQPAPINDEEDYRPIRTQAETASLKQAAIGRYTNRDGSVEILVEDSNHLVLIQTDGPNNDSREESSYPYSLMTNQTGGPVIFSRDVGVIHISNGNTLSYNGDTYRRTN